MSKRLLLVLCVISLITVSCGKRGPVAEVNGPTSGHLTIAADEALKPIIEAEVQAFMGLSPKAHLKVHYISEAAAMDSLLKDSLTLVFITRPITADEQATLQAKKIKDRQSKIAVGGIALIVHPDNPDTMITVDQLKNILSGKLSDWNQLSQRKSLPLNVVFDQPNSSMIKFLNDSVMPIASLPKNCFAVDSNAAVVDYVMKHPEALGLIDVSWISDEDDATTNVFRHSIKVVRMADAEGGVFHQPYQAYLSLGQYPLIRNIYMITTESYAGLATGFTRFVASDKGQRIILKSGLVPATMPVRIVDINRKGF